MDPRWPVQDAKARFSELLQATIKEGPQIVTKRGVEAAVLVPIDEWRRLERAARPGVRTLLLEEPRIAFPLLPRGQLRRREARAGS